MSSALRNIEYIKFLQEVIPIPNGWYSMREPLPNKDFIALADPHLDRAIILRGEMLDGCTIAQNILTHQVMHCTTLVVWADRYLADDSHC